MSTFICPIISIENLQILHSVLTNHEGPKARLEMIGPKNIDISAAICSKQQSFWRGMGILHHVLSKYLIASHNFSNSTFKMSSLYHSIQVEKLLQRDWS